MDNKTKYIGISATAFAAALVEEHKIIAKMLHRYEILEGKMANDDNIGKIDYANVVSTRNEYRRLEKVLRIRLKTIGVGCNKGQYTVTFNGGEWTKVEHHQDKDEKENPDNND